MIKFTRATTVTQGIYLQFETFGFRVAENPRSVWFFRECPIESKR